MDGALGNRTHNVKGCTSDGTRDKDTEITVDASPVGLGTILAQTNPDTGDKHVVAYTSRSLATVSKGTAKQNARHLLWYGVVSTFAFTYTGNQSPS